MSRGIAYTREVRNKAISRKKRICRDIYNPSSHVLGESPVPGHYYDVDGKYSKGKIRCDCKICKYSRHYGLPTLLTMREESKFKADLLDYEKDKYF